MATNEQVIERINKLEEMLVERIEKVDEKATKNDAAIRGNGDAGLKAQVAENTKTLNEVRWYFRGVLMIVLADFVSHILSIY